MTNSVAKKEVQTGRVPGKIFQALLLFFLTMAYINSSWSAAPFSRQDHCQAFAQKDLSTIEEAPGTIAAANYIKNKESAGAYCQIDGQIDPNIHFSLFLPDHNWNGKFLKVGCGGLCGAVWDWACKPYVRRGYACAVSDMGHTGPLEQWAHNNLKAEIDFGFRATHVVTLAGKALLEQYYAKPQDYAYYLGCSTGGRQGLMEAQQYPWDFDGIVAGAPSLSLKSLMHGLWAHRQMHRDGQLLFDADDLRHLNAAVVAQCDGKDGLVDGIITAPRQCDIDLDRLSCARDSSEACFSEPQLSAIQNLWQGPAPGDDGTRIPGGLTPGSELDWLNLFVGEQADKPATYITDYRGEVLRYQAYYEDKGKGWDIDRFDYRRDYRRLSTMDRFLAADNPDLRQFQALGGKLLIYQGMNDPLTIPATTLDYYRGVERILGGPEQAQQTARLFLMPGMGHCTGGKGAFAFDYLKAIENWVEKGEAPEVLIGAHTTADNPYPYSHPPQPDSITLTRPVFAYPKTSVYAGGDPDKASSFKALSPKAE